MAFPKDWTTEELICERLDLLVDLDEGNLTDEGIEAAIESITAINEELKRRGEEGQGDYDSPARGGAGFIA